VDWDKEGRVSIVQLTAGIDKPTPTDDNPTTTNPLNLALINIYAPNGTSNPVAPPKPEPFSARNMTAIWPSTGF
jgi:hypothetical protein